MEFKGTVIFVGPTDQVNDQFKKRELVVRYAENPQYPEEIKLEAVQAKTDLLNNVNEGDEVEVFFNLKGRGTEMKSGPKAGTKQYFNQLQLWKINILEAADTPSYSGAADLSSAPDDDDLPF